MSEREQLIRERAYELWERAGRPEGEQEAHWREAERQIDAETGEEHDLLGLAETPGLAEAVAEPFEVAGDPEAPAEDPVPTRVAQATTEEAVAGGRAPGRRRRA